MGRMADTGGPPAPYHRPGLGCHVEAAVPRLRARWRAVASGVRILDGALVDAHSSRVRRVSVRWRPAWSPSQRSRSGRSISAENANAGSPLEEGSPTAHPRLRASRPTSAWPPAPRWHSRSRPHRPTTASASIASGGTAGLAPGESSTWRRRSPCRRTSRSRSPTTPPASSTVATGPPRLPGRCPPTSPASTALCSNGSTSRASATTCCSSCASSGASDILVQTSDSTWQAYNTWGGRCLYPWIGARGYKVSYNRPLNHYFQESSFFSMEYPLFAGSSATATTSPTAATSTPTARHRCSRTARCSSPAATTSTGRAPCGRMSRRLGKRACTSSS